MLGVMLCFSQGFCVSVFMFGKIAVLVLIEERSRVTLLVCKDHSNWTTRHTHISTSQPLPVTCVPPCSFFT